jgi:hypothetical protein
MQELYNRFIEQLDSLVVFLALSSEEVYRLISDRWSLWLPEDRRNALPEQFSTYRTQVAHAGFLLGYSYAEAFLNDLARHIYLTRPDLLPKDERLRFEEILGLADYDDVVRHMVETTLFQMLRGSMPRIIRHFETVLQSTLPVDQTNAMIEASKIRNCIVHRMAVVDKELAETSERWQRGQKIELTVNDVHEFGTLARTVADEITKRTLERFGGKPTSD